MISSHRLSDMSPRDLVRRPRHIHGTLGGRVTASFALFVHTLFKYVRVSARVHTHLCADIGVARSTSGSAHVGADSDARIYVELAATLSREAADRFAPHLESVVPSVTAILESNDSDEIRECCIQAFEAFAVRCPRHMEPHIGSLLDLALKYALANTSPLQATRVDWLPCSCTFARCSRYLYFICRFLTHDPNYMYDDDDEDEMGGSDDEDEFGDDDDEDVCLPLRFLSNRYLVLHFLSHVDVS